jgi:hypothetical protein
VIDGKRRKNLRATAKGKKLLAEAREKLVELAGEIIDDNNALAARKKNGNQMPDAE